MNNILFLAGYSCAGKTTLGEAFCKEKNVFRIHQQSIYRRLAEKRGFTSAREWLNTIGRENFITSTTEETISYIKKSNLSGNVLIDESYNTYQIQQFRRTFPDSRVFVISVKANQEIRVTRMTERLGLSTNLDSERELDFRDSFLKEAGLDEVLTNSDIEVDNSRNIKESIEEMSNKLKLLGVSF